VAIVAAVHNSATPNFSTSSSSFSVIGLTVLPTHLNCFPGRRLRPHQPFDGGLGDGFLGRVVQVGQCLLQGGKLDGQIAGLGKLSTGLLDNSDDEVDITPGDNGLVNDAFHIADGYAIALPAGLGGGRFASHGLWLHL